MEEIIVGIILFAISLLMFILSIRSFRGKGFLLNNAYIYADKRERESMDKKPYYHQTAIVCYTTACGCAFLKNFKNTEKSISERKDNDSKTNTRY